MYNNKAATTTVQCTGQKKARTLPPTVGGKGFVVSAMGYGCGEGGRGAKQAFLPRAGRGGSRPSVLPFDMPKREGEEGLAAVATAQHCWMDGAAPARYKGAPALRNWNHHRNCSYDFCKSRVQVQYLLVVRIFGHLLNSFPWADHHFPRCPFGCQLRLLLLLFAARRPGEKIGRTAKPIWPSVPRGGRGTRDRSGGETEPPR